MTINRNNYESFFLLYADGELSQSEKQLVDEFVVLHPDLKEELDMLLETVLFTPANIAMPGKEALLKPELWEEKHISPLQNQLLMLLDNELPSQQAGEVTAAIGQSDLLQTEWDLLQQTRLESAVIEMPEKHTLYRSDRDRRFVPVRAIQWMAAAAVVAGLGWYGFTAWNNGNALPGTSGGIAVLPTPRIAPSPSTSINPDNTVTSRDQQSLDQPEPSASLAANFVSQQASSDQTNNLVKPKESDISANATTRGSGQQEMEKTLGSVELSPSALAMIKPREDAITPGSTLKVDGIETSSLPQLAVNNEPEQSLVQQAAYHEDPFVYDNDEYVTIAGARIKKQKLRGVFRNVTRTITRTFDKSNIAEADYARMK